MYHEYVTRLMHNTYEYFIRPDDDLQAYKYYNKQGVII